MKVALLSFNFPQYCIRLANGLAQSADVLLLLPREDSEPYRFGLDPAVELFQFDEPRLRQPVRQLRMIGQIVRRLRAFRPDVVHQQAGHLWFNLVWPLLRAYPVVVSIHESRHHLGDRDSLRTPQRIMDVGYHRADRIVVHGKQLREAVVTDLGLPRDLIDVIPAVPDIVLAEADLARPVQEDPRRILFFGRIWPYKGLDYLIKAEPLITEQVPEAQIVIAGRGEDFDSYRRMMVHPDRFLVENGYISDPDLVDHFRRSAVVVLPYIDGSISGVVPVACTFGKPVVATTVGILPEMVDDGRTGFVVPPRDEKAIASAVVKLLRDDRLRRELGANARHRAETVFDPVSVAEQTIATYERAIESRRG